MDIKEYSIIIIGHSVLARELQAILTAVGETVERWDSIPPLKPGGAIQYYMIYIDSLSELNTISANYKHIPSLRLVGQPLFKDINFQDSPHNIIRECTKKILCTVERINSSKNSHLDYIKKTGNKILKCLNAK